MVMAPQALARGGKDTWRNPVPGHKPPGSRLLMFLSQEETERAIAPPGASPAQPIAWRDESDSGGVGSHGRSRFFLVSGAVDRFQFGLGDSARGFERDPVRPVVGLEHRLHLLQPGTRHLDKFLNALRSNDGANILSLVPQAKLDDLAASGEVLADVPWVSGLGLVVQAALGCGEIETG